MSVLKLEGVSYVYGAGTPFAVEALKDIDIEFGENRITGIIGHTGSGKSTLARLLNGLEKPAKGKVLIDGRDIWENPKAIGKIRNRVGLVFQYPEYQLFEETVYKDIAYGPSNLGKSQEEIKRLVTSAAEFTGLTAELLERSPFDLSGGQKRRAAIAGVIAMDPDVIVFDEPAAGLDPRGREDILSGIKRYQQSQKKTVILISHSMEDMARYADELVVMKKGTICLSGTVSEVFRHTDMITGSGLAVPRITELMQMLKSAGYPVSGSVYTVDEAVREIVSAAKKARGISAD